tara:strand:- start:3613 stop:4359 length:747 start_codon:yes stop_codon:yes gene_type:complete
MAITKPTSGSVITPSSVEDMHTTLRTTVNAIDPTSIGRQSINHYQLSTASLVQKATVSNQTTFTLIDNKVSDYNTTAGTVGLVYSSASQLLTEVTSWDVLNSITYTTALTPKTSSPMIIQYNMRVMDLRDASGNAVTIPYVTFTIWFALVLERTDASGSADNIVIEESVNCVDFGEGLVYRHDASSTVNRNKTDQPVAFSVVHETEEGYSYSKVALYSAINPQAATSTTYNGAVTNGVLSLLLLEPGA